MWLRRAWWGRRPRVLAAGRGPLASEFFPSWCGVGGSVVGAALGGVCPVAPVGRGWGVAQGPCLAVVACGGRQDAVGLLGALLFVELVLCGCGFVGFSGIELTCGVCHCGEGIHAVWVQGHVFDICVV
ncbi:hypothetical protein XENORESO_002052, partial [Xenotaenia resolanae]